MATTYTSGDDPIEKLVSQILNQGITNKWSGQGHGSAEANARDMAKILAGIGITDIRQFGEVDVPADVEVTPVYGYRTEYVWGENGFEIGSVPYVTGYTGPDGKPVDPKIVKTVDVGPATEADQGSSYFAAPVGKKKSYGNKVTGQAVPNTYSERQTGNAWGGTFAGKGNTGYRVQFAPDGTPIFYTTYATSNDLAILMEDMGVAGQIALAIATGGLSIPQQIALRMALDVASGKDIGDAVKNAAIGMAVANIPGAEVVKEGSAYLNGIDSSGVLAKSFETAATSASKAALTGQDIGKAILSGAVTGGVAGSVDFMLKGVDGFEDLSSAEKAAAKTAINGVISGKQLDQVLIDSAISAANAQIKTDKDNRIAKEAGWSDYAQQQAAQSIYGPKVTPAEFANKQETTEEEAKQIARSILGREPTEFEYMPLIGLSENAAAQNSDLQSIRYDESTFDSSELAQAYKDVYGKEPTDEWMAENIDLLGRSDAQGKNMLQALYNQEKNTPPTVNPDPPKQDLSQDEADRLRAALGLPPETRSDGGSQSAGVNTGTTSDAGGGGDAAPFADAKAGIAGYLGGSVGGDTGISRNDDGTYTVYDPSNNLAYKFSSDGSYMGSAYHVDVSLSSEGSRPTTQIAQDFIGAFTNSPYAKSLTGSAVVNGSDAGASTGAQSGSNSNQPTSGGGAQDADFWKSIGIDPSTFGDSSPSLSNEELMAIVGYGKAATQPVDGSGKPMYGDVSGEFGGGAFNGFSLVSEDGNAKVYENDGFTLIARANGTSVLLDKTDPNPEPIWLDPVDSSKLVQSSATETPAIQQPPVTPPVEPPVTPVVTPPVTPTETAPVVPPVEPPKPTANVTPQEVEKIVNDAIKANPSLTKEDVQKIVSDAVATVPNLTADQVKNIVGSELEKVPAGLTATDVQKTVDAAKNELTKAVEKVAEGAASGDADLKKAIEALQAAGLTPLDVQNTVEASAANQSAATKQVIADANKGLATSAALDNTRNDLAKEIQAAKDIGLQGAAAIQAGLDSLSAKMGVDQAALLAQMGTTANDLKAQFSSEIAASNTATATEIANTKTSLQAAIAEAKAAGLDGDAALKAAIDSVAATQQTSAADLLSKIGATEAGLKSEFQAGLAGVSSDVEATRTALTQAIKAAQDMGLQGDAALRAAIDSVAADQQTNAADLLGKLGTTEAALRSDMQAGLAGVAASVADTKAALEAAIADAKATGLSGDAALKAAIETVAANQQTNSADLLTKLGTTEAGLKSEFAAGLAGVSAEVADVQRNLSAEIQAAKDIGLQGDAALQAGLDSLSQKMGVNQSGLLSQLGTTAEGLKAQFASEIAASQTATAAEIASTKVALEAAIAEAKASGLQGDAALKAAIDSVAATQQTNSADLLAKLGTTEAGLKTEFAAGLAGVSAEVADTRKALEEAIQAAKDIGLQGDAALQAGLDSVAASLNTTKEALLGQLGTTEQALRTEFASGISGLEAQMQEQYNALTAAQKAEADARVAQGQTLAEAIAAAQATTTGQITALEAATKAQYDTLTAAQKVTADALVAQGQTLQDAITTAKTETAGQIAGVETRLTDAIAAAEAMGLSRDQAITAAVESVAADLGTTKEALLGQLGKTEEALRSEFSTGIAGLEATTKAQYEALTAAQKATADALVTQGKTLQDAITAAKTETAGQISGVESRLTDAIAAAEAMGLSRDQAITAAVESVAADLGTTKEALLSQLGKTEQALRTEFGTGLAGVSAEVKAAYDSLSTSQKALADQLQQQGVDMATAIQQAQAQTAGQIGALTADVQAKYDALTAEQKALANQIAGQGVDLNIAIEQAKAQTQQQIADLGADVNNRINELMQQGQSYQQATQQAFAEVNAKNAELSGLIGTQGRTANQSDIDALTQMLGGQRSIDLNYDVTGDKQITQADIDFLTGVVNKTNTDWMAPAQSPWAATGLYGQIQANELKRQQDLASSIAEREAAEAKRVADEKAAAAATAAAAREAQRQSNINSTMGQAQQGLRSVTQQLQDVQTAGMAPQQARVVEAGPGFDVSDALNTGFFSGIQSKKEQQNQQQPTKIAVGGYIDDLLAEDMTVDDLLNLLR